MFVLGITGGIGCGKSTVADFCRQAGLVVIDADEISHRVTSPGGSALDGLIELFGKDIIKADGTPDRKTMAGVVFSDRRMLDSLSELVHREVTAEIQRRVADLEKDGCQAVVLDVPIPVKEGFLDLCDQIWVVWAADDLRIDRLKERGMQPEEAKRRIAMQMDKEAYLKIADHVLENDGSLADLKTATTDLLKSQLRERGIRLRLN